METLLNQIISVINQLNIPAWILPAISGIISAIIAYIMGRRTSYANISERHEERQYRIQEKIREYEGDLLKSSKEINKLQNKLLQSYQEIKQLKQTNELHQQGK